MAGAAARNLLECMLLDDSIVPTNLPISLLESITNDFSDDQKIGSGGFANVYKGILQNGTIAVKKLFNGLDMEEIKFIKEVSCLTRAKHKNIVRFLGYCADAHGKILNHEAKMVIAEERHRLLCFEFLPEGSLDKYITDVSEGLEWGSRYQIIRGICDGLHYLHHQRIAHLDLKPANILLDHCMVPKIADFGISKCFDEEQSRAITLNMYGSRGYMSPESYGGVVTLKSDIYSLGIIIMEILTGQKGCPIIENVLESWRTRFKTSQGDTRLEPIRVCAKIGIECTDFNPVKRPDTRRIIERLDEMEHTYGIILADFFTSSKKGSMFVSEAPSPLQRITSSVPKGLGETSTEMLDVHPLELRFPFELSKVIECPVTLTNRTHDHVGVWITPKHKRRFPDLWKRDPLEDPCLSLFKVIEPHSTVVVGMIMKKQSQQPLQDTCNFEVIMIVMGSKNDTLENLRSSIGIKLNMDGELLKTVEELGGEVHRAMLKAIICKPASCLRRNFQETFIATPEFLGHIDSIDMHPKEPWILVVAARFVNSPGNTVFIFNYQNQETLMTLDAVKNRSIHSAKFISEEQWFTTGVSDGWVHVYADITKDGVKKFKAHDSSVNLMAVHPTYPFLLTASSYDTDKNIKLWDWRQNWKCTRKFDQHYYPNSVMWNPLDTGIFACISGRGIQVWEIRSSDPIITLREPKVRACCFSGDGSQRKFFAAFRGLHEGYACIWDMQTMELLHKLVLSLSSVHDFVCHPTRPILVTTDRLSKTVHLWDARTYRIVKIFQLTEAPLTTEDMVVFTGTKDLPRLVVRCEKGIAILDINLNGDENYKGFAWSTMDTTHT